MKKHGCLFASAALAALLTLIALAAFPAVAAGDGTVRKDGLAARLEPAGDSDGQFVFELTVTNESCEYSDTFSVTAAGLDVGYAFSAEPASLKLAGGESGKSLITVAPKPVETTDGVQETEAAGKRGCGSALSAAIIVPAIVSAVALGRGGKKRAAVLLLAVMLIPAASVFGAGAAVTHRSLPLDAKFGTGDAETAFTVKIEYDYGFKEEPVQATTGMSEFGITYYWGPHGDQAVDESFWQKIAECGFTTVPLENNTLENNKIALGYMKKYGLTCSSVWDTRIWQLVESTAPVTDEQIEKTVAEVIADYAEFDNIRGWWLQDEPSAAKFPILGRIVAAFRKLDPDRECLINLFPNYAKASTQLLTSNYDDYVARFVSEVKPGYLSYDHYHFLLDSGARRGFYSNFETIRAAGLANNIDYMSIILLTKHDRYADLSYSQILFEVNMSLAYGAKRISYFTFILDQYLLDEHWDNACMSYLGEIYPHYYDVQKINALILPLGRELFGKRSVGVYQVGMSSLEEGCQKYDGYGDLGMIEGKSWTVGFFDDGSFMIVNRKYVEGNLGKNSVTFVDVTSGLEYFDAETASWKEYTSRDADGRYIYECRAGEGLLFRVK